ncbi:RNA polymerase B, partial [Conoideocrella luteorostrata]
MPNIAPGSRPKAIPPSEQVENAEFLQLGEFQGVDTLTVSEAALVVSAVLAKRGIDCNTVQHNP